MTSVGTFAAPPGRSLNEQLNEINRLNALLRSFFQEHLRELECDLAALSADPGMRGSVERLSKLEELVISQIEQAELSCGRLNEVNNALRKVGCLKDAELTGVYWLLSRELVSLWQTMWSPGNWVGSFAGEEEGEIRLKLLAFFNMVRSRVVQHSEMRSRETVLLMQQFNQRTR